MHLWDLWKPRRYALARLELLEALRPRADAKPPERIRETIEKPLVLPPGPHADFWKVR